ncbi:MAG: hypothetical protein Q7Q71_02910 [Verrucomicrobiota bacterium JB023]|nr:hypothetical protein [Verrucomicrobiota bacterium JB023]
MDLIHFQCPHCGNELTVPREVAHLTGPCPRCGTVIQGPASSPPAPLPPPTPTVPPALELETPPPPTTEREAAYPAPFGETPESSPSPEPAKSGGLSLPASIALALCSGLIFGVLGFVVGRTVSQAPPGPPSTADVAHPSSEVATEEPTATQLPTAGGAAPPIIDARTTLEAFLNAPGWSTRSVHVIAPDEVMEEMESLATQNNQDRPIPFSQIDLALDEPERRVYSVYNDDFPDGILVELHLVNGRWKIHWPHFAEIFYRRFEHFVTTPGPAAASFRVFARPAAGESDPYQPSRLQVAALNSTTFRTLTLDEEARDKYSDWLKSLVENGLFTRQEVISEGIPLVLEISKSAATPPSLTGRDIISTSWWSR